LLSYKKTLNHFSPIRQQKLLKFKFQNEKEKTRGLFFVSKMEPLVQHVSSFSVPILNFNHGLLGAITVVGITDTVPKSTDHPTGKYVLNVAREISKYFGFER
jgi:DNA-binding IclR family transcriptional regulator